MPDAAQRYYTLMRLGIARDVAFAITANPATLIQMARIADEQSDTLIRDVREGTLAESVVDDGDLRGVLSAGFAPRRTAGGGTRTASIRSRCAAAA